MHTPELILRLLFCHFVGDYVLQSDFLARSKGKSWYHLLIHAMLYALPFYIAFGYDWQVWYLIVTHFIVDMLKARFGLITYVQDQALHLLYLVCYLRF